MKHQLQTFTRSEFKIKAFIGGWEIICPTCKKSLASGMNGAPSPDWVSCNGLEPLKMGINKEIEVQIIMNKGTKVEVGFTF